MVLWMIATLVGFVLWQATGSSVAQYVAVASIMLHFAPYVEELHDTSLSLSADEGQGGEVRSGHRPASPTRTRALAHPLTPKSDRSRAMRAHAPSRRSALADLKRDAATRSEEAPLPAS